MKSVLLILLWMAGSVLGTLANPANDLSKYQALFIYKFTEYFEWDQAQNLTIGVFGNTRVIGELEQFVAKRDNRITVKKIAGLEDISDCQIIFLADDQQRNLELLLEKTQGDAVLIVTETPDLAQQGAGISFYVENDRLKFQLNVESIEARKIRINSSIRGIATVVRG